jgi:hypothetical protein
MERVFSFFNALGEPALKPLADNPWRVAIWGGLAVGALWALEVALLVT